LFPAAGGHPAAAPRQSGYREQYAGSGTVLLIDDEEMVRNMARTTLQRYGYSVLEAENGRAALDRFVARLNEIDLVVLDLTMPVMSGEDTLAALRRIRRDMPVVLSSGFSETEAVLRFEGHDLAGFLQKPYTVTQLVETVRSVISVAQPNPAA
jgi:CheY-like chemotaxis protein